MSHCSYYPSSRVSSPDRRLSSAAGDLILVFGLQIARIAEYSEIGPTARLVNCVNRFIHSLLETGGRGQRQMAPSRKPNHADPLRIDFPFFGPAADETDCPLGIE